MTPQEQNIVASLAMQSMQDQNTRNALLSDPAGTLSRHGVNLGASPPKIVALEDTATLFNLVVPLGPTTRQLMQLPPNPSPFAIATWIITNIQKHTPIASSLASDPVPVLRQMGVNIPPGVQIKVWNETANTRYMVLPYFGSTSTVPAELRSRFVAQDKGSSGPPRFTDGGGGDTVNVNVNVNVNTAVNLNAVAVVNVAAVATAAVEAAVAESSAVVAAEVVVVLII